MSSKGDAPPPVPLPQPPLTREQRLDAITRIMLKGAERLLAEREAAEREKRSA